MKKRPSLSRRSFLKAGATTAMATGLTPALVSMVHTPAEAAFSPLNKWPGRVVINYNNTHKATQYGGTTADKATLQRMVDDAIKLLTGETTVGEAWKALFPLTGPKTLNATTKIAIKINILNSAVVAGHWSIVKGIVEGLMQMNVGTLASPATLSRSNITIYDGNNSTESFSSKLYNSTNFPGITLVNSDPQSGSELGARALNNADFLINIPGMRGHGSEFGGVTLGFKSHYGSFPTNCHGDAVACPAYLRDINCTGLVYDKTILTVCNAIYATNIGNGPATGGSPDSYNTYAKTMDPNVSSTRPNCDTLIMSTDPVAAEFQIIKCMRINQGESYTTISMPDYLKISAGIPVGDNTAYNIGVIDESQQTVGKIVNETIVSSIATEKYFNLKEDEFRLTVSLNPVIQNAYFDIWTPSALNGKKVLFEIYDLQGRVVFEAKPTILGACTHLVWNGKNRNGRVVASGKYIAYIMIDKTVRQSTFTLLR